MTITSKTYTDLQTAYDHFNAAIFGNALPEVLLTLVPHKAAYGYFRHEAFTYGGPDKEKHTLAVASLKKLREGKRGIIHELALNPFTFNGRTDEEILGTLVHEMVHLWQHVHGTPGKKPGHNREWADKMKSVGLHPSTTGAVGGKETGRRCSHYIIAGGVFQKAAKSCKVKFAFSGMMVEKAKKGPKRTKFTCPSCDSNAYGTSDLNIRCNDCGEDMTTGE